MTTLHLVRHGSHDALHLLSGRSDIGINAAGRAEAARAADRLARSGVTRIQSSPRPRALETAEILAERLGREIEVADALDEIDFGDWTGLTFDALAHDARWRRWNEARGSAPAAGGETMRQAVARVQAHVDAIEGDGPVVCVSHCDIIRGLVAASLGLDLDRLLGFDCDPGSITTLTLGDGGARVVTLNERPQ